MPLSQIVSASIEDGAVAPVDLSSVAQYYGFKNRIINGAMGIWQRATTSGSAGYQTADRWYENASNSTTFAQETSNVPTGFQNAFKMTAGATAQMWIQQPIETKNCYDLRGQTVTVSFVGAASTTTNISIFLYFSASADNPAAGSWTAISSSTFSVGTSYATYSATFTVPSNALTVMPQIVTTSTVTSGTIIYITGVQLEKGVTATSFDYRPYGTELQLCQRYLPAYSYNSSGTAGYEQIGSGYWTSSTSTYIFVPHPVNTRVPPTGLVIDAASNFLNLYTSNLQTTGIVWTATAGVRGSLITATATGGAAGGGVILITKNTGGLLYFTGCEL